MKVWRKFHKNIPSRLEANFDHRPSNQLTKENDMLAYIEILEEHRITTNCNKNIIIIIIWEQP